MSPDNKNNTDSTNNSDNTHSLDRKNPNSNLNNHYTVLLEGGLVVALVLFIIAMNVHIRPSNNNGPVAQKQQVVKMKKVHQTEQKKKPPPPSAPVVPVKVPNDVALKNQHVTFDVDLSNHQDLPAPPKEHHASKSKSSQEKIFVAVGKMPKLKGGYVALQKKVKYPAQCRNANIQGRVTVQFVVNKQGKPTNVHVTRGIGGGCDEAAVTAVKKYARFTVGRQRGKPVKVQMSLPIVFRLQH
jgi:protein TonB